MNVEELYFRQWGMSRTDVGSIMAILSIAAGFNCTPYIGNFEVGHKFQVKPHNDARGVDEFWQWCIKNRELWYDTVPHAAVEFLKSWHLWQREQSK